MNIKEEMEELAREFEDALVFNNPILPVLHKAHLSKTDIHFMSMDRFLMRVRLVRNTKFGIISVDVAFDPETLQTSVFYPKAEAKDAD